MSEPWRTETVVALCQAMRQTGDYSATPILADALQDASYGDEEMLRVLRGTPPRWQAERLVALIYSGKTAEAVRRIEDIAQLLGPGVIGEIGDDGQEVPMSFENLIEAARIWLDHQELTIQQFDEKWRDTFPSLAQQFWENHHIITGRKPPDHTVSFFGCSC